MRRVAIGAVSALALGGCSHGGGDGSRSSTQVAESQAAAVVLRLDGLIRAGRYDQVCDDLLTPRARARAGGARCARRMRVRTAGLVQPRISLLGVRAAGPEVRAQVQVASGTGGTGNRTVVLARAGRSLRVDGIAR